MGKAKELSVDSRQKVNDIYKSGNNFDSIPRSTVKYVIKKFSLFCSTEILPERGRIHKLSPRTARKLCHDVEANPRIVLSDICSMLEAQGTSVSTRTIQRCLNRS